MSDSGFGVRCPLCHRRVVTTEAPCECGFRFPRGYGQRYPNEQEFPHDEARLHAEAALNTEWRINNRYPGVGEHVRLAHYVLALLDREQACPFEHGGPERG